MNPDTTHLLLIGAVIGTIQVIKHTFGDNRISGFLTILIAVVLGILAGRYGIEGLNVGTGILTSLAAIGTVTLADRLGTITTTPTN